MINRQVVYPEVEPSCLLVSECGSTKTTTRVLFLFSAKAKEADELRCQVVYLE